MSVATNRPTLMIIGGFLGAGKTTTILKLAESLQRRGLRFGIVTNDQGSDLVDTRFLRSNGLVVNEVTGGCFCCNFNQFADALAGNSKNADVILAEPVGSCTDLVATLFRPLRAEQTRRFDLAPLAVVVDPRRAKRFLAERGSPEINYLFEKQTEEADILLLNKIDTIEDEERTHMIGALRARFPGREIIPISARQEQGIDTVLDAVGGGVHNDANLQISYDRYGASEAALGWLNLRAIITNAATIDSNELARELLRRVGSGSRERGWEIAHAKVYLVGGLDHTKASLVDETAEPVVDAEMFSSPSTLELVLNARVAAPAAALDELVQSIIFDAVPARKDGDGPAVSVESSSAFQPAYPTPTHRMER